MGNPFKPGRTLWLALLLTAPSVPMGAQLNSGTGHITIIAIMPENLSLSVNSNGAAYSTPLASHSEVPGAVATGITMTWSLMPGRAKVATFVIVDRPNMPIIIADSSAYGVSPFADERGSQPHGFHLPPYVSNTQLSQSNLTDIRRGASTVGLPDLVDAGQRRQLRDDTPVGILKIQVQPIL